MLNELEKKKNSYNDRKQSIQILSPLDPLTNYTKIFLIYTRVYRYSIILNEKQLTRIVDCIL